MTFLITNDDGIDAPGLRALFNAVMVLGDRFPGETMIAAPRDHQSGCGHQVTTAVPIHVQPRFDLEFDLENADYRGSAYAIAGTPADCVRIALSHLCPKVKWVLSGINAGGNLGADVYISGTVAAVREAALHRVPAIAISHYRQGRRPIDWDLAALLTSKVLSDLLTQPVMPGTFWNVNLPHLEPGAPMPEIVFCSPCTQPLPNAYRVEGENFFYVGEYSNRPRDSGGDVEVCFSGRIAVTNIRI